MSVQYRHGRWWAILSVRSNGTRTQPWVALTVTDPKQQKEAEKEERALRVKQDRGEALQASTDRYQSILDEWLSLQRGRPKTLSNDRGLIAHYIGPALGEYRLKDISPEHIIALLEELRKKTDQHRALGERTLGMLYRVLNASLDLAVAKGKLPRNPCLSVPKPTGASQPVLAMTERQVQQLLDACPTEPYGPLFVLALYTGLRRSELLGLQWSSINLRNRTLAVVRGVHQLKDKVYELPPKTESSRRVLSLSATALQVLAELPQDGPWVFGGQTPWRPIDVTRAWVALARRLKMRVRMHDLRHTHASWLLRDGVPLIEVSHRLGHSNVAVTAKVYSHYMPGRDQDVADAFEDAVRALRKPALTGAG